MGDIKIDPSTGNCGFGSGLHGWAFTLKQFAEMYAAKFGIDLDKLMIRLWGENFYNPKTKKWSKQKTSADEMRSFNFFVLDPLYKIFDAVMKFKKEDTAKLLEKLNIELKLEDKEKEGWYFTRKRVRFFAW